MPAVVHADDNPMGSDRPDAMNVLRDAESWFSCEVDLPPKLINFLKPVYRCCGGGLPAFLRAHREALASRSSAVLRTRRVSFDLA
jgi:hypothetical protein